MPLLTVDNLGHSYGDRSVLDGLSFTVEPGELVSVLGPSGCGKTTLLRSVAGLLTPSRGAIRIGDAEVVRDGRLTVDASRRGVGLVFQDYALFPTLTATENIGFGLRPADPSRVRELLDAAGLTEVAGQRPHQLSGGQQQRVALARALAPRPKLLLLDEPFANVDAQRRDQLGIDLRGALAREQRTALMVTHDRDAALSLGDRVLVLTPGPQGGQLAQYDTPMAVYTQPANADVARLTGSASLIPGTRTGQQVVTPLGNFATQAGPSTEVHVVARPEQLQWTTDAAGPCEVVHRWFLGRGWRLRVQHPQLGELEAESVGPAPEVGAKGSLTASSQLWSVEAQ